LLVIQDTPHIVKLPFVLFSLQQHDGEIPGQELAVAKNHLAELLYSVILGLNHIGRGLRKTVVLEMMFVVHAHVLSRKLFSSYLPRSNDPLHRRPGCR
jgi:hypothetical protein